MSDTSLNVRELLRLLVEQQATLVKFQQLVVEHVLSESRPDPVTGGTSIASAASDLGAAPNAMVSSPLPEVLGQPDQDDVSLSQRASVTAIPTSTPQENRGLLPDSQEPVPSPPEELPSTSAPAAPTDSPFGVAPPKEEGTATLTTQPASVPAAVNSRVGRYLNRPASAPAKQVTNQELYRLSRLREVGDVAQLVLQFGEYRGVTLFQVAQTDPDYLRSLALTAQRPQVRAAAVQLVRALEASDQFSARRRSAKKTRASRHDA
jgi:hypothetical protein